MGSKTFLEEKIGLGAKSNARELTQKYGRRIDGAENRGLESQGNR